MRLQVIDTESRFECHGCGDCCTSPWRVLIEDKKVAAIENYNWPDKYQQLAGRTLISTDEATGKDEHVLAKQDDGACIFYHHDTEKCIIHAELGMEAKPHTCQQFPLDASAAPDGDRTFAHYSCPSVRDDKGPKLIEDEENIHRLVKPTKGWDRQDVPFTQDICLTIEQSTLFADRLTDLFDTRERGDPWQRFAQAIQLAVAVGRTDAEQLDQALRDPALGTEPPDMELVGYASLRQSPLTPRTLLGINLWGDLFPDDTVGKTVGIGQRVGMIMKLLQVVRMRGTYASTILKMNISLGKLSAQSIVAPLPAESSDMLRKWIRSRLLARSFAIDELTILAGLHVLILDFDTMVMMARAQAIQTGVPPTHAMYKEALSRVVALVVAQTRSFKLIFPSWTLSNLDSPTAAWSSLRLFHPMTPTESSSSTPQTAQASK